MRSHKFLLVCVCVWGGGGGVSGRGRGGSGEDHVPHCVSNIASYWGPSQWDFSFQSCSEHVKELTGQIQKMMDELYDLEYRIRESSRGFKEQVTTILSMPPPRLLYQGQKVGTEAMGVPALPPGRSTLQPPQRGGRGHERKGSGDRRSRGGEKKGEDRRGFTSTL